MDFIKPPPHEVKITRLLKRVAELKIQRNIFEEKYLRYKEVIDYAPHLEKSYDRYKQGMIDKKRIKELECRCQEQSMLITKLTKQEQ